MTTKKHFTHINMNTLRGNKKHGRTEPVVTVKSGSKNRYGYGARVSGKMTLAYSGNGKPLISCGARVALISELEPEVIEDPVCTSLNGVEIRIHGRTINSNKRRDELAPVIEIHTQEGEVIACYGAEIEGEARVAQVISEGFQTVTIWAQGKISPILNPPEEAEMVA